MAERDDHKGQLVAEMAAARGSLTRRRAAVRERFDFGAKFRKTLARNAFAGLGGAVLLGGILSRLPARKTKVQIKRRDPVDAGTVAKTGPLVTVAKLAFDAARPTLMKVAMTQLQPLIHRMVNRWRKPD